MEPSCALVAYGPLAECLRDRGVLSAWLERVGASEQELQTPARRLSFAQMTSAWRAAVDLTGDERIGLQAGAAFVPGALDVFDHMARAHRTLEEAALSGGPFITLLNEMWTYEVELHGVEGRLVHRPPLGVELLPQMTEYLLALVVTLGRSMGGPQLEPSEVHFTHEVDGDAPHREMFRSTVHFGAMESCIVVPSKVLRRPLRGADPSLVRVLERFVGELEANREGRGHTRDNVARLIAEQLPDEVTAGRIAKLMGISERTLRRKLDVEKTSFSQLLDAVRRRLAMAYLEDAKLSVASIAEQLGYFDASSFHKAFKRWTGRSPGDHRTH